MKVKADEQTIIRITYDNQIIFQATLEQILKMFPPISQNELTGKFRVEIEK